MNKTQKLKDEIEKLEKLEKGKLGDIQLEGDNLKGYKSILFEKSLAQRSLWECKAELKGRTEMKEEVLKLIDGCERRNKIRIKSDAEEDLKELKQKIKQK